MNIEEINFNNVGENIKEKVCDLAKKYSSKKSAPYIICFIIFTLALIPFLIKFIQSIANPYDLDNKFEWWIIFVIGILLFLSVFSLIYMIKWIKVGKVNTDSIKITKVLIKNIIINTSESASDDHPVSFNYYDYEIETLDNKQIFYKKTNNRFDYLTFNNSSINVGDEVSLIKYNDNNYFITYNEL